MQNISESELEAAEAEVEEEEISIAALTRGLPEGWEVAKNASGYPYYFNKDTYAVQWERPHGARRVTMPEGWTMHEAEDGDVFYYSSRLRRSTWTEPQFLDALLEEGKDQ